MVLQDRERPYVGPTKPYNPYDAHTTTESITVFDESGEHVHQGGDALMRYAQIRPLGPDPVLFHGTFKPPFQIGRMLTPTQAYSSHLAGKLEPHGRPAISFSAEPQMPIVRSFFHRKSPALKDYPEDDHLFAKVKDIVGGEIIIITQEALERVSNMIGYIYVAPARLPEGTYAERLKEAYSLDHEYRYYQDVAPIFVMPVLIADLPLNIAVAKDSNTAKRTIEGIRRSNFESSAQVGDLKTIYGDPIISGSNYTF